jgi:hypothetical protein
MAKKTQEQTAAQIDRMSAKIGNFSKGEGFTKEGQTQVKRYEDHKGNVSTRLSQGANSNFERKDLIVRPGNDYPITSSHTGMPVAGDNQTIPADQQRSFAATVLNKARIKSTRYPGRSY